MTHRKIRSELMKHSRSSVHEKFDLSELVGGLMQEQLLLYIYSKFFLFLFTCPFQCRHPV